MSFFWTPSFFIAELVAKSINIFIPKLVNTSGYGFFYQFFAGITNIFLGIFGLYLIYQLLKEYFPEKVALLATSTLFLTTNLFFYIAVEPINSHAVSFFVSSLFVYYFVKHTKDKHYYLILGVIGGVAGLIRTQDLLILVLPSIKILSEKPGTRTFTTYFLSLTSGFFIGFLPQILIWKFFFYTYWYSPYIHYGFDFLKPHVLFVLFNRQNGLLTITPIILFAFLGILMLRHKLSTLKFYCISYFLLQLYLISSWSAYYQGGSYSIRMIITTYPLIVFGLAEVIGRVSKKSKIFTYILISLFACFNFASIINYLLTF